MKNKSFVIILCAYFFISIGNNLIHSITTPFIQDFLKIDSVYFGIYYSMMSLGQVIGAFLCGFLSQKIKLKKLLIIGNVGYAFFQLMFGFVNFNPNIVIIWRLCSGLFISFPNTLILVFALKYIDKSDRVRGLSILASVNILGVAIGYEIAGLLHDYVFLDNYYLSFVFQGCWCVLTAIFVLLFVKNIEQDKVQENVNYISVLKKMPLSKKMFFCAFLLSSLATIIVSKFFEPFFQNIGNKLFSSSDLAHIVLLTSINGVVANLFLIPLIKQNKNIKSSYLFTLFVLLSSVLVFVIFSQKNEILLVIYIFSLYLIYSMIRYLIVPLEQNISTKNVNENDIASYISLRQVILSLAQVLGPLLTTRLFSYNMSFPFYVASVLFLCSGLIMILSFKVSKIK